MKYFLLVLAAVIIIAFFYIRNALNNFTFNDVKFVGGNIREILSGGAFTAINLSQTIDNKNSFSVPVSGLYIELYHQGKLIGQSTSAQPDFDIPAMGSFTINQSMTVNINSSLSIAAKILAGAPVIFDYTIRAKLFKFFPLTYNGSFTY